MSRENPLILIVDDVPRNIQIVGNILKKAGYAINFANNGQKALEHTGKHNYDLILLDIMMPEMDGFEVARKLKTDEQTTGIPIIFLTAKTDTESITKAFDAGGVDYVTKPFNSAELLARVKTHIRLKNREQDLIALNKTKDKFFSIIAHDLKNPFNTLLGYSELLRRKYREYSNERVEQMIETIYNSSRRNYDLLENLLIWSRTQTNRINYNPAIIDAATLIHESFGVIEDTAKNKGITIREDIEEKVLIYADFDMITLVVRNLMSNAIKFTPEGGDIRVEAKKTSNGVVRVCVHDSGIGIPPEKKEKIFDIGESTTTAGTKNETGTGLGLILCKEFINKHNGKIWIESKPGVGSSFCFTLEQAREKRTEPRADNQGIAEKLQRELFDQKAYQSLLTDLQAAHNMVSRSMNIKAIREFADNAVQYGSNYNIEALTHYGNALQESAENFDIQNIKELLEIFEQKS